MKQWKWLGLLFCAVFLLSGGLLTGLIFPLKGTSPSAHAAAPARAAPTCSWKRVTSQNPSVETSLVGVAALSSADVWAVGDQQVSTGAGKERTDLTLVEHWDGTGWQVVPSPSPSPSLNSLAAVARVPGTNELWAVGIQGEPVSNPNPGSSANGLSSVAAISATDIWAVGAQFLGNQTDRTLVEHWDGTQWTVDGSPNAGQDDNGLNAVTGVPGSQQAWAVGLHANPPTGLPLRTFTLVHC